jgi:head-tail adaptor
MLLAGSLRHTIIIERAHKEQNATGQEIETWRPLTGEIQCNAEPVGGMEIRYGRQMDALTNWLIRMRHPQGAFEPNAMDRVTYGTRVLNITRPPYDPNGKNSELHIQVREKDNDG